MLRITKSNGGGVTTFKLEGKLAGEWVNELRNCWQEVGEGAAIRLDLTGVSWASEEGKALLGEMYHRGAELLAANLLMASIVAEISAESADRNTSTDRNTSQSKGGNQL